MNNDDYRYELQYKLNRERVDELLEEKEREEREWRCEDSSWFCEPADDGFNYVLTKEHRECLYSRLGHVSECLDDVWDDCLRIAEDNPDDEKRDKYIEDIYRFIRWSKNNLSDIKIKHYVNSKWDYEYVEKCIDMLVTIKHQIYMMRDKIAAFEKPNSYELVKYLFALWNVADDVLMEIVSWRDDIQLEAA